MPQFKVESVVDAQADRLYQELFCMNGVNYELMPIVKMTAPSHWSSKHLTECLVETELFTSTILLFGLIPVDLHKFKLSSFNQSGFVEHSSSLTQKEWIHRRTIKSLGATSLVTDEIEFKFKLRFLGNIVKPLYLWIFQHRHKRLKTKYREII